ncbi:hypothetical protein VUR80DRAFT_2661 [Thermomyces stellatus]
MSWNVDQLRSLQRPGPETRQKGRSPYQEDEERRSVPEARINNSGTRRTRNALGPVLTPGGFWSITGGVNADRLRRILLAALGPCSGKSTLGRTPRSALKTVRKCNVVVRRKLQGTLSQKGGRSDRSDVGTRPATRSLRTSGVQVDACMWQIESARQSAKKKDSGRPSDRLKPVRSS